MLLSQGSVSILWSNWLVGSITTLALLLLVWPLLTYALQMLKGMVGRSDGAADGTPEHR
jgi:putative tricarboxylic transport membrane protein